MHNIKDIRQNPDIFQKELSKGFVNIDLKTILSLDEKNRKLIKDKETLEKEKKDISKNKDSSLFEKLSGFFLISLMLCIFFRFFFN